ncbi:GL16023 [Drosophila persimilis]|uniref:GL16023 n=1 Tax=Drosophila persimilis TaxID=7234 RepID=B4H9Z3_DROPE|nr:GL16023 [Drosophila persimilis]
MSYPEGTQPSHESCVGITQARKRQEMADEVGFLDERTLDPQAYSSCGYQAVAMVRPERTCSFRSFSFSFSSTNHAATPLPQPLPLPMPLNLPLPQPQLLVSPHLLAGWVKNYWHGKTYFGVKIEKFLLYKELRVS